MDYPIVYDKFTTVFTNYGLGVLDNAKDPFIFQRLNGEHTLEFSLPLYDEKSGLVVADNFIQYAGQIYIIRDKTEIKTKSEESILVFCEHVFTELLDEFIDDLTLDSVTGQFAIDELLTGTRFTGNALSLAGLHDLTIKRANPLKGINKMIDLWGCEMQPDNYNIILKPQIGNDFGVQFRYRKNLDSIKRKVDARNVITRLHVYGKDDLTTVIDSQFIANYPRPKIGQVTFSEVTTLGALNDNGAAYLAANEVPKITYDMTVIELKHLTGYEFEAFSLGDTIKVIDDELGMNVQARIFEYKFYPNSLEKSSVVLGNFIPSSADDMSKLKDIRQTTDQVFSNGRINTYWLDGAINTAKNQLVNSGSYQNAEVIDGQGLLFENTDPVSSDHGAVYIGPGIVAIASEKDGQGQWIWRTFGKGTGFIADEIKAGKILTSVVQIVGEENHFYWDAGALYCKDATDTNKQIRLSKEGLQFTTNGGSSWDTAMNYNGLTVSAAKVNLLQNGGAEIYTGRSGANIPDGWTVYAGSPGLVTHTRRVNDFSWTISGNASFEITTGVPQVGAPSNSFWQDVYGVIPGQNYTVSALLGAHRCTVSLELFFFDVADTLLAHPTITHNTSVVTKKTITQAVPANTTRVRVEIRKHDTDAGQVNSYLFADEVKFERGDSASPYIETDIGAAGTINNGVQIGSTYSDVVINGAVGVKATHANGDYTQLSGAGLRRFVQSSGNLQEFNYLVDVGSGQTGSAGMYFDGGGGASENGSSANIGTVWVQLPDDFKGKTFKVAPAAKGSDPMAMAGLDGEPFNIPEFMGKTYIAVKTYDYPNGKFEIEGWAYYLYMNSSFEIYEKYYAIEFSYMAVV